MLFAPAYTMSVLALRDWANRSGKLEIVHFVLKRLAFPLALGTEYTNLGTNYRSLAV